MIKISFAGVWVHDQEKALAFYTESSAGGAGRSDVSLGEYRWLTVGRRTTRHLRARRTPSPVRRCSTRPLPARSGA